MTRIARALRRSQATPVAPRAGVIGGLIALVAAAMAFLAVAAAEAGLAADRVAARWASELSTAATVRISVEPLKMEATTTAALSVLAIAPGVLSAEVISLDENRALLEPWLGPDADLAALPLPVLIDVRLAEGGPDVADVQRQLDVAAPGAVYDDHGAWSAPLIDAAKGLRRVAAIAAALTVAALAAMVAVAAAATLWSGAGVVRTLRLIGAEDRFISGAFERPFALRAAMGATIGALAALIASSRAPRIEGMEALTAIGASAPEGASWWLLPVAPLVAGVTALLATRVAAAYVLRRG